MRWSNIPNLIISEFIVLIQTRESYNQLITVATSRFWMPMRTTEIRCCYVRVMLSQKLMNCAHFRHFIIGLVIALSTKAYKWRMCLLSVAVAYENEAATERKMHNDDIE